MVTQATVPPPSPDLETALGAALARATAGSPPTLRAAIAHAVFPGGARLRPRLCLAVADACGAPDATGAAVAVELMHCASLVHDDLPCFDDAAERRGVPSVHKKYGEAAAVLAGDALIVLALEQVARFPELALLLARAAGPSGGLVAGQAWELERAAPLAAYHRAKTASLFEAAATMAAVLGGQPPEPWRAFGEAVGQAYQAADDVADVRGGAGKTSGRDAALRRPSVVRSYGVEAARRRVRSLIGEASRRVPACHRRDAIILWLEHFGVRTAALGV